MNRALLIVDVQNGFVSENTKHIPAKVESLQRDYDVVFATRFINLPDSLYRKLIRWNCLSPGTEDVELAFKPGKDVVVLDKNVYTCVNSDFLDMLKDRKIDAVDICGMDTDICVTKCAVDLFENGVTPFVLKDYCATNAGKEINDAALHILARYIGKSQII